MTITKAAANAGQRDSAPSSARLQGAESRGACGADCGECRRFWFIEPPCVEGEALLQRRSIGRYPHGLCGPVVSDGTAASRARFRTCPVCGKYIHRTRLVPLRKDV